VQLIESEIEREHIDTLLAENAEKSVLVVSVTSASTRSTGKLRAFRRGTWNSAAAG